MNANKKVILIIILGVGACLLSFFFSRLFLEKEQTNKAILYEIQQAAPHLKQIRLLTTYFIQNTDPETWNEIKEEMKVVSNYCDPENFKKAEWQVEAADLKRSLDVYNLLLTQLYYPVIKLHEHKLALQGIGLSFIDEVEKGIIQPFRKEEGVRLYDGEPLDLIKSRVKDTAYDLVALYNKQQLILLELLLNADMDRYRRAKRELAEALAKHETQLRYIAILMADDAGIHGTIISLEDKLDNLVRTEQIIVNQFIILSKMSDRIESAGDALVVSSQTLADKIRADTEASNTFYGRMTWGLVVVLIVSLILLGAWLGRDIIHFVHDLRETQGELQESETNLRVTLNSIGDAVICTDASGVITRINPSAERLTEWQSDEAVGRPLNEVFQIVHALKRVPMANPVEKILESGEIIGLANHTVLISKYGREYQISDSGAPIRNDDGSVVGVVMVFRDVTEAYANEQRIRDSEQLLMNLTANVPGLFFQYGVDQDTDTIIPQFIGPNAADILGINVPKEDFYTVFIQHLPEEEKERFETSVQNAIRNAKPWSWTGRFIKAAGEEIWLSGEAVFQTENGRIMYYGVMMDITERKQWDQALKVSEQRYKRLFNEAPMMYVINEDHEGKPIIRHVNEMFLHLLGYEREDVLGRPLKDFYTEESASLMLDKGGYARSLKGEFEPDERDLVTRDGRKIHTLLHAVPEYDEQDNVVGTRAMFLDITQRKLAQQETKRLESALNQAQKMEAIGTLAGGIAHDFNNILTAVIGYSELIISNVGQDSPLYDNLEQIFLAGLRAKDLVEQILAFSRQSEWELKPLQVGPLVKEALKLLRSSLPATIEIQQHILPDLDNIMADPTQIHQIVMNLCTNAGHAMEETGGILTVGLSVVNLDALDVRLYPGLSPGKYIELVVQDTGPGIPPEIRENIFDPYFTTKKKGKGTGLGLSVVHGIVQNYGGAIQAYSEMGQGTSFKVYFPAIQQFQAREDRSIDPPKGNERILLVDDEPILTEVGQLTLERLGYSVQIANSAFEALDILQHAPGEIDLVISDMTMPKMTGDQLTAKILEIRDDLPIILCTGFSNRITKERAKETGARALIMKPFVAKEMALVVRQVLDETEPESIKS